MRRKGRFHLLKACRVERQKISGLILVDLSKPLVQLTTGRGVSPVDAATPTGAVVQKLPCTSKMLQQPPGKPFQFT